MDRLRLPGALGGGTATLWKTVLVGLALQCVVWFAGTFATRMASGQAVQAATGAAALYPAAFGCFASLSRTYGGVDASTVSSDAYRIAHGIYNTAWARLLSCG